jgi:hypothetical protein
VSAFSDQLGIDWEEALRTADVPTLPDPFPQPGTAAFDAFMLEAQQNSWQAAMAVLEPYLRPPVLLVFGSRDVHSTAVRYLTAAPMTANAVASASDASIIAPFDGELRSLSVRHPNTNGPGSDIRYTARIDDGNTALAVEVATGAVGSAFLGGQAISFDAGAGLVVVADPLGDLAGDTAIQPIATLEIVRT